VVLIASCDRALVWAGGSAAVRDVVAKMSAAGVPLSAVWIQDWCGSTIATAQKRVLFDWQAGSCDYPDWWQLVAELGKVGIRVMSYVNPFLTPNSVASPCGIPRTALYTHAANAGYLVMDGDGKQPLYTHEEVVFGNGTPSPFQPRAVPQPSSAAAQADSPCANRGCQAPPRSTSPRATPRHGSVTRCCAAACSACASTATSRRPSSCPPPTRRPSSASVRPHGLQRDWPSHRRLGDEFQRAPAPSCFLPPPRKDTAVASRLPIALRL
jgi:hypothetical protein